MFSKSLGQAALLLLASHVAAQSSSSSTVPVGSVITTSAASSTSSVPPPESINPTSSYYSPGVPTDQPIPGNYAGYLRPQVHFSPPIHFMNDPNGMHRDANGTWHIYYQYNPTTDVAGNQHWGHATSPDLYTWTNQKIAVWPPNDYTYVFSGSAVVDPNNTSGFFPDQDNGVVAIYTLAEYPNNMQGVQYQAIAYSRDGGYTFEAYAGNPVIDIGSTQFRDPYVIWYEPGQHWVMVVSHASVYSIEIYTSTNLKNWTAQSNFTRGGLLGIQYECPNLRKMPMRGNPDGEWYLQISINPGSPRGGSVAEYFVGDFNGTHFTPHDNAARLAGFGKDSYAAQFFNGVPWDEPQVAMTWASNWEYTQLVPTGDVWEGEYRSAFGAPQCYTLANVSEAAYDLLAGPCHIETVFEQELAMNKSLGNGSILIDFRDLYSNALYLEANVTGIDNTTLQGSINFTVSSSVSGEYVRGGTVLNGPIWMDRGHTYLFDNPYFSDKFSTTPTFNQTSAGGVWGLALLIDRSIMELFYLPGASQTATNTFFPTAPLDTLRIDIGGIAATAGSSVAVWGLKSTWQDQENVNGTVVGNNTANSTSPGGYGMAKLF